jgi:hypothetical protein
MVVNSSTHAITLALTIATKLIVLGIRQNKVVLDLKVLRSSLIAKKTPLNIRIINIIHSPRIIVNPNLNPSSFDNRTQ